MTPAISLTDEASSHLNDDLNGRFLRIAFTTGCGGSGYRISYAESPDEGDVIVKIGSIPLALDSMAASKLDGALITFDPEEEGYLLEHENAVTAVWCG